ncbi:MAG: SGNH/GDSL hydrolase family protein [Eubacteriales bacterium]|nr:SGNH/GDSL hydrolase family protein [Eubacteriales bacterium]
MPKKILVVGDSLSKGVVYDENKNKYIILKDCFFNLVADKIDADMINVSRFGSTVTQGKKQLEHSFDKYDPDIVVIEFGGNDCDFIWDDIANDPTLNHIPKTPLDVFEESIGAMVDFIENKGKKIVLSTLPPLYADNYFRWFTNNDKDKGLKVLKWLKDIWHIYWWHERYSNCIQYIARQRNIGCIDVRREFLKIKDFADYICVDGIHPNQAGHRLIFDAVINYIKEYAAYLLPSYAV